MRGVLTILVTLAAAGAVAQSPAPATDLTFEEAMSRALTTNPAIGRAAEEVRVAQALQKQTFSAVLPRVTLSGNLLRNSREVSFGSGSDARTVLPENDWNYRLVLSQPIYAGQRERRAYEQTKLNVTNARESSRDAREDILFRVSSSYLAAVDAGRIMEIEQKNIDLAQKRREQANNFYQAGEKTKVDVLRAVTAIQVERRLLANAEQQRESAIGRLRADLGLDGPIVVHAPDHALPSLPDEATLVAQAEETRPELAVARNNLKIASLEIRKQRGFYFPVVTADAGYVSQKSTFPADKYGYGALRFNVPIYQGGEVEARVAGAKAKEIEARLALEEVEANVREDVRQALTALHTAETNLVLANEQLASAEAEYSQMFELYRAQEATSLDLSDAESSLAEARRVVASSILDRDLSQLRVWYAAGSLQNVVLEKH